MNREIELLYAVCRNDYLAFARVCFGETYPGQVFESAPYLALIASRLTAIDIDGAQHNRQIFNLAPRTLKSFMCTVVLAAWMLGRNPEYQIIVASHTNALASRHLSQIRQIIGSQLYNRIFPGVVLETNNESQLTTSRGGGIMTVSFESGPTGFGCHVMIIDDPLKAEDANNPEALQTCEDFYREVLSSRFNHPIKNSILLVMQRLAPDDLSGRLAKDGNFEVLSLPLVATEREDIPYDRNARFVRDIGESLSPERFTQEAIELLKRDRSDANWAAQYQQAPILGGGITIKPEHLTHTRIPLRGHQIFQSWDTASSTSEKAAYSACLTFVVEGDRVQLIDVHRARISPDEIGNVARSQYFQHRPKVVLVEEANTGFTVSTTLRAIPGAVVETVRPIQSKEKRLEECRGMFVNKRVLLPEDADWLDTYKSELLAFPHSRYKDQVDATTQFLTWILPRMEGVIDDRRIRKHPFVTGGQVYDGANETYRVGRGTYRGTSNTMRPRNPRGRW